MKILSSNFIKKKEFEISDGYFFHFNTNNSLLFNINNKSKLLIVESYYKRLTLKIHHDFFKERIHIDKCEYIIFKRKLSQRKLYSIYPVSSDKQNKENTVM